jgi:hypothetical protein
MLELNKTFEENKIPSVQDLLGEDNIKGVLEDAETIGFDIVRTFFTKGATKAPIKKQQLKDFASISCLLGEMKSVQRMLAFLETSNVIDGFDPNHDLVQSLYGELCMYLLKLDQMLLIKYKVKSTVNKNEIEKRTQNYIDNFYKKRERIYKLQEMLEKTN